MSRLDPKSILKKVQGEGNEQKNKSSINMKLNVNIEYRTSWGESIDLCLGGKRYPMSYVDNGIWTAEISRASLKKHTEYSYEVMRDGQTVRKEWKAHVLLLPEGYAPKSLTVNDRWNDRPEDAPCGKESARQKCR